MKYIRYIKESNEEELEKYFLDIIHFSELKIEFDFMLSPYDLFYEYNGDLIIGILKRKKIAFLKNNIWKDFSNTYKLSFGEIEDLFKIYIGKNFKYEDFEIKIL